MKKREDAIEQFLASPTPATELAESYKAEVTVLQEFLDASSQTRSPMSPEDLLSTLQKLRDELQIDIGDGKAMGRLIKEARQRLTEGEALSKDIAAAARKVLNG